MPDLGRGLIWPRYRDEGAVEDEPCGCARYCGDDGDQDGPGECKGLALPPRDPVIEIVLIPRAAALRSKHPSEEDR